MATWIATLDPDTSSDPKSFSKAFQTKYLSCPSRQVRLGKDLFSRRQGPTESVDDYFVAIQSLAHQLDITINDDILRHAIVAGLRPNIAGIVMALSKAPTIDELLEVARAAELIASSSTPESTAVADLTSEIRRLSAKIDSSTVHQISQSPRRVRFDDHSRSPSPAPRHDQQATRQQYPERQRQYQQYHQPHYQRQFPDRKSVNYQQPPTYQQQPTFSGQSLSFRCSRCSYLHDPNSLCPAMKPGRTCKSCGLPGHFQAACRSSRLNRGGRFQGGYNQ